MRKVVYELHDGGSSVLLVDAEGRERAIFGHADGGPVARKVAELLGVRCVTVRV